MKNTDIHRASFQVIFKPNYGFEKGDETYYPYTHEVSDALHSGVLDLGNSYHVEESKRSADKVVFTLEVTNSNTDEYIPSDGDIKFAIKRYGGIDTWNIIEVKQKSRTISKCVYREKQLIKLGI